MQTFTLKSPSMPCDFSRDPFVDFSKAHGFTGNDQSICAPGSLWYSPAMRFTAQFHGYSFPETSTKAGHVSCHSPMQKLSVELPSIPCTCCHDSIVDSIVDLIKAYGVAGDHQSMGVPGSLQENKVYSFEQAFIDVEHPDAAVRFAVMLRGRTYSKSEMTGCVQIPDPEGAGLQLINHPLESDLMLCNLPCTFCSDTLIGFINHLGLAGKYASESVRVPMRMNTRRSKKYSKGYGFCKFNDSNAAIEFISKFHGCSFPGSSTKVGRVSLRSPRQKLSLKLSNIPCTFSRDSVVDFIKEYGFAGDYQSICVPGSLRENKFYNFGYAVINFEHPDAAISFVAMFHGCAYPESGTAGCVQIADPKDAEFQLHEHAWLIHQLSL